jgi:Ca-activated chloride channel homolog
MLIAMSNRTLPRLVRPCLVPGLLLLAATLGPVASGARSSTPEAPQARFYDTEEAVGWVMVPVVVKSPEGYRRDLEEKDFRLFVDGKPVRIESFDTGAEAPVSVIFLQDISGSMATAGKLDGSREAISMFLEQARAGDEFALASFGAGTVQVDLPYTQDVSAAREVMASWEAYGTTALQDAVAWLPELTAQQDSLRRAAILITDGLDNASAMQPAVARDLLRRAELPVYVLGLDTGSAYRLNAAGKKVYRVADMLNLLASLTGGRYHAVAGPYALKEACEEVFADLRHQYVLGFSTAGQGAGSHHALRVEVRGREQKALSFRRGYRGGEPVRAEATRRR